MWGRGAGGEQKRKGGEDEKNVRNENVRRPCATNKLTVVNNNYIYIYIYIYI